MGDFNLNLVNFQNHQNTGEFLDGLHSNMLFPMITRPTRITSHTATLLDNIFANKCFDHSRGGLLITDISDHLPVFSIHSNKYLLLVEFKTRIRYLQSGPKKTRLIRCSSYGFFLFGGPETSAGRTI